MPYYDTVNETQHNKEAYQEKTKLQDDIVLQIAQDLGRPFSASEIFNNYPNSRTPITSIRRSIHTLCNLKNKIIETGKKVKGIYGRNEKQYVVI